MTRKSLALILASTTSLCGTAAWAQATTSADAAVHTSETAIQEVIVTAQKRNERVSDVPLSITAVTADQLAKAGVNSPADLEKVVPGFTYQPSSFGTPVFTIRGIGFFDTAVAVAPAVTVYVDQVPLPYLAMAEGAALDLERVEALKGPQGTLFGQNSTGGAINYIAAKPTRTLHAGADLSYGRFNAVEAQGFVSGPLTDTLSARVAVRTEQRGDWQRSLTRNDGLGKRDFTSGRLLLDWRPTDRTQLELSASGWVDKSDTMAAQYVEYSATSNAYNDLESAIRANRPAPDKARAADWDPNTSLRRDDYFYQVAAHGEVRLSDAITLTSITAYSHLKQDAPSDTDGVPQNNFEVRVRAKIDAFSQELRLAGDMERFRWMLGANYGNDRTKDDQAGHFTSSNNGVGPFRYNDFINSNHQKIENEAVFASVDYKLTDSLTAQASARYNKETRKFQGCLYDAGDGALGTAFGFLSSLLTGQSVTVPPGSCVTLGDGVTGQPGVPVDLVRKQLDQNNVSWRVGLSWKPASDSLLYANVTRGYKAGSFPTVPGLVPAQFDPVTQEAITAYEAGFKSTLFDRSLQVTGAAFYYDYRNKQILGYITTGFGNLPGLVNIPTSSVRGVEFNVNWHPTRGLTINGGATYIKSQVDKSFFTNDPNNNLVDVKGEDFPSTPHWQVLLDAEYEAPLNDKLDGFIGGNAHYRSAAVAAFGGLPEFRLPGYTLVDLHAGVETADKRWRAQVWGRNVFDKFYLVHVSHVVDTVARVAGMPATYGVSVSYRY